ncbi:hypothetical protein GND95_03870 [Defluviitalea raffinosedens]|uniref:Uncharacterized protein n=1 Tax=Defluviitalea raffinosedens TaxID=1450156 RepID=A0A7C8HJ49_9FIRM|nr:hypothetical protein GND95_03870 [Defluviitalea raffinosedens]
MGCYYSTEKSRCNGCFYGYVNKKSIGSFYLDFGGYFYCLENCQWHYWADHKYCAVDGKSFPRRFNR